MIAPTNATIDKIILGHNSFFGVDHLSNSRGQERESYFNDPQRIIDLIQLAKKKGISGLMLSTHSRAEGILKILSQKNLQDSLRLYPLLPYVQKYVVAANQKGLLNVVLDVLSEAKGTEKLRMLWSGAKGVLGKDFRNILKSLIQIELQPFRTFQCPHIFLHDAFTDLALAFGMKEIFEFYIEEIQQTYKSEAAFTTKNLPTLLYQLKEWKLGTPVIMAHVNACGFSMNPSKEAVEEALRVYPARILAMSTLASGFLKPKEAYSYLATVSGIESIVVGVSSEKHLDEVYHAIQSDLFKEHSRTIPQKEKTPCAESLEPLVS